MLGHHKHHFTHRPIDRPMCMQATCISYVSCIHSPCFSRSRLTLRCTLEVLSRNVGERGLLCISRTEDEAAPGKPKKLLSGGLPCCCRFSARKCSTLASKSRQSRRLSFKASCRCLCTRSFAITCHSGRPKALGAVSNEGWKSTHGTYRERERERGKHIKHEEDIPANPRAWIKIACVKQLCEFKHTVPFNLIQIIFSG